MANSQIISPTVLSPPVRRKEQRQLQASPKASYSSQYGSQYTPQEEQPSIGQQFIGAAGSTLAQGLGQGLVEGFGSKIKSVLEASALKKAIGGLDKNASPLDQYLQISQMPLDANVKNELLKNYLPMIAEQRNAQLQQEQQSTLGNILGNLSGTTQQRQPYTEVNQQTNRLPENVSIDPDQFARLPLASQKALVDQINKNKKFNASQSQHEAKLGFQEKQLALGETKSFREKLLNSQESAIVDQMHLDRLEELVNSGKLSTPLMVATLGKLGIPLGAVTSGETQEFEKLSNDMLKNITQYFGNRILKTEVDTFLKTIPTLMQSDEGKRRIIHNLRLLKIPEKLQYDAYKEVVNENRGIPLDLREQVIEKMAPAVEQLSQEFKGGLPGAIQRQTEQVAPVNTTRLMRNGIEYNIPNDRVQSAMQSGFSMQQQVPQQQMIPQQQFTEQQMLPSPQPIAPQQTAQMSLPPTMPMFNTQQIATPTPVQAPNNLFQPQIPIGGITQ